MGVDKRGMCLVQAWGGTVRDGLPKDTTFKLKCRERRSPEREGCVHAHTCVYVCVRGVGSQFTLSMRMRKTSPGKVTVCQAGGTCQNTHSGGQGTPGKATFNASSGKGGSPLFFIFLGPHRVTGAQEVFIE